MNPDVKGYGEIGDLISAIDSGKSSVTTIIESFSTEINAIRECWVGVDADSYLQKLENALSISKNNVENVFDSLKRELQASHDAWVEKQNRGA